MSELKHKLSNYSLALESLESFLKLDLNSDVEKAGVIHAFRYSFECAWKAIQSYAESQGFEVVSPKSALKVALKLKLIDGDKLWLDMLLSRNLIVHTYNRELADKTFSEIQQKYAMQLRNLLNLLNKNSTDANEP